MGAGAMGTGFGEFVPPAATRAQQADVTEVMATVNTVARTTMVARWNGMIPFTQPPSLNYIG
jgi:hypothetical protein